MPYYLFRLYNRIISSQILFAICFFYLIWEFEYEVSAVKSSPILIYLNQLSFDLSLDHLSFEFVSIGSDQFN
jgi:hypothetical protein